MLRSSVPSIGLRQMVWKIPPRGTVVKKNESKLWSITMRHSFDSFADCFGEGW